MSEWVYQIPPEYQWFTMNPSFPLIIESTTLASTLLFFLIDHSYSPLDYFVQCCFPWVKRESNSAAHVTAKLSLASSESFCLNKDNLPRVVHSACLGDCLSALSVWIKIEVYQKKKKHRERIRISRELQTNV